MYCDGVGGKGGGLRQSARCGIILANMLVHILNRLCAEGCQFSFILFFWFMFVLFFDKNEAEKISDKCYVLLLERIFLQMKNYNFPYSPKKSNNNTLSRNKFAIDILSILYTHPPACNHNKPPNHLSIPRGPNVKCCNQAKPIDYKPWFPRLVC